MRRRYGQIVLFPLLIACSTLALGFHAHDAWIAVRSGHAFDLVPSSYAEAAPDAAPAPAKAIPLPDSATASLPQAAADAGQNAPAVKPASADSAAPPLSGGAAASGTSAKMPGVEDMSQSEIEILQQLAKRRQELDTRAHELDQRQSLLDATEQRINSKVAEMQKLRDQIADMMNTVKDKQADQLKSLVKIYENMKPADAARILETLDMPILTGVFREMKETKSAPILASMNPAKARALTDALMEKKDIPDMGDKSP